MSSETNYINAEFIKKWAYQFFARLFPIVALFIITIFYSRKLSYELYGTFQTVWMYSNIVTVIIGFGITTILLSTSPGILSSFIKINRRIIIGCYALLIAGSFAGFYLFEKNLSSGCVVLVIIFSCLQLFIFIRESLLLKEGKEARLFYINLLYSLFFVSWHLYLLYYNYNLITLIIGILIITVLKQGLLGYDFSLINSEGGFLVIQHGFGKHWIFTGINDIVGILSKWIDKLFLLYLISASEFAIFFNGSFEIPMVGLLITVAGNILMVEVSKKTDDKAEVVSNFQKNYSLLSTILFPLFFFLLFNSPVLFGVLFNHKYDRSIPIFIITLFILPIRINNYGALLQCYSKGNIVMAGSIIDIILVFILMNILYPVMSTQGVALAVVAGTYVQILYYLIQSSKVLQIGIWKLLPGRKVWIQFVLLGLIFLIIYWVPIRGWAMAKAITGMIITLLSIFTGLFRFLKPLSKSKHGAAS